MSKESYTNTTRDRVANADPRQVATATMKLLNCLQNNSPAIQIASASVLFLCLCDRFQQWPTDMMDFMSRLMKKSGGYDHCTFEAVKNYLKEEV